MRLFAAAGILLSTATYAEVPTKEACAFWQSEMKQINSQMPIQIDFTTSWVGVSAIYASGRCHIANTFIIDDKKFLETMAKHWGMTPGQAREYLNSDEGWRQFMEVSLKDDIEIARGVVRDVKNVTVIRQYSTSGLIKSFKTEVTSEMIANKAR